MKPECVFCGSVDETIGWLDEYGLGLVGDKPVDAVVCQGCPLPTYGSYDPDPDPAVFELTPDPTNTYLIMTRRMEGISA